jgi:hypothetical protein
VTPDAVTKNPELQSLGQFKTESVPIAGIAKSLPVAQKILDKTGYR